MVATNQAVAEDGITTLAQTKADKTELTSKADQSDVHAALASMRSIATELTANYTAVDTEHSALFVALNNGA